MQLSKRMQAIANMVSRGNVVADIGTDHAYIPIYLVENGISPRALAMDINKGPLERAGQHISEHKLNDYIEARLSAGLDKFNDKDAQTIIIAGMGGILSMEILRDGLSKLKNLKEIILQPQSDIESVRRFLDSNNFELIDEEMVKEDGKYYFIMKAVNGRQIMSKDEEYIYGKKLLEKKHPILFEFLERERAKYQGIKSELEKNNSNSSMQRIEEVSKILRINEIARSYWR